MNLVRRLVKCGMLEPKNKAESGELVMKRAVKEEFDSEEDYDT